MKRIFHHHDKWEEHKAGMWRTVHGSAREQFIQAAGDLMRAPQAFKSAMLKAVYEWKHSCEANLTSIAVNRQAWLGHAGCCIATGSPEECTRLGWHTLTATEQDEANRVADEAIAEWERNHLSCQNGNLELMF